MKVILLRDVARLGRKSEVKEVPDGHALNHLIPRKLAIIATEENMKRLKAEERKSAVEEGVRTQVFKEAVAKLNEGVISYEVDANEKGHLFQGIHREAIATHLKTHGINLGEEMIVLEQPIKSLGMYELPIRLGKESGVCRLEVVKK